MPRHKLTDAFIRNVKPPSAGQIEYWDALTPGFGIRVSYGGRKAFQAMTRINGKLHRFSLGFYPRSSLADARAQAEQVLRDAAKGISPKDRDAEEQRQAQAERLNSFRAVAAEFMEDHAKNLRTRYEVQRMINVDLLPAWGDRPISSITRADIKALLREKASTAPIAANRVLSLISKIFSWALDEEIIGASPADAQRTIRIVGEDGKVDFVAINQRVAALDYVMNDVTVAAECHNLDSGTAASRQSGDALCGGFAEHGQHHDCQHLHWWAGCFQLTWRNSEARSLAVHSWWGRGPLRDAAWRVRHSVAYRQCVAEDRAGLHD